MTFTCRYRWTGRPRCWAISARAAAPIAFSRRAAFADDDRLLAVALDQDLLADFGRAVGAVFPGLGFDRRRIGQLLVELIDDLLAGQLGGDHAVGGVGDFVFGIEPRAFGHRIGKRLLEVLDAVALGGADHEHLVRVETGREVRR